MRPLFPLGWLIALAGVNVASSIHADSLTPLPFQKVQIKDDFWSKRIQINRTATIEANLHQCEITGRIRNFAIAGKLEEGKHKGLLFDDSDLYKVIEGIAYTLSSQRDADLEKRTDAIIDKIAAAQQPDGYLNTYFTLVKPRQRWKNIQNGHELYCAGHLIEAAVAYQQATGKRKLLDAAIELADHIHRTFGPGTKVDTSGHEEIELALIKLYWATKEKRYLQLAQFFLDVRGRADKRRLFGEYAQDHKPIRAQNEVAGHAVRAMYLYCGMADAAGISGDKELLAAITKIWHDVVERKMYVTGGIGPSASNEGFTVPYDLPNDSAYAETCAAIGMALWNHRMFLMSGDGKYADVLEREVYNGLISGVSLNGDRFFYVNPLGSVGRHHRVPWFDCSCCPTNIVRYIPGMGERVWAHRDNAVWSVLYLGNSATVPLKNGKVRLIEKTKYPWDGVIEITVEPENSFIFDINMRIPAWCRVEPSLTVNGAKIDAAVERGYVRLRRTWNKGDVIRLSLPMPVERVYADPHVKADMGRVALQRGPIVYCLEGVDNGGSVRNLCLPKETKLTAKFDKDLLGGVAIVQGEALAVSRAGENLETKPVAFRAVPYFAWDNRAPGQMIVWLAETPQRAEVPGEDGVVVQGVRIRASHLNATDTLETLRDGGVPMSSKDHNIRRMTWWDHRGTVEWLSYRTAKPRKLSAASVYWFDDSGMGACRVPAEWRLLWLDGDEWKPVKLLRDVYYGTALDRFNQVSFEPVTTRELRLEVKLKPSYSGGVLKWRVTKAE
ncbi:MAG: glycoside hydrolase family 127 protein [Gemmataceae bacterium]